MASSFDRSLAAFATEVSRDAKVVVSIDSSASPSNWGVVYTLTVVTVHPEGAFRAGVASAPVMSGTPLPSSEVKPRLAGTKDKKRGRRGPHPSLLFTPSPSPSEEPESLLPVADVPAAAALAAAAEVPVAATATAHALTKRPARTPPPPPPHDHPVFGSAFTGRQCVALAFIKYDATSLLLDLEEEMSRPVPADAHAMQQCPESTLPSDPLEPTTWGAYGFCQKHYDLLPTATEEEFEYLFAGVAFVLRLARNAGVVAYLTGGTAIAALLFQGPDPTAKTCFLAVRCDAEHPLMRTLASEARAHGHLLSSTPSGFSLRSTSLLGNLVSVEVAFVSEEASVETFRELSYGGLPCLVHDKMCAAGEASTRLLFDHRPSVDTGSVNSIELAVPLSMYKDMRKITFPSPHGYGFDMPWSLPAPPLYGAQGLAVFDPALMALFTRMANANARGEATATCLLPPGFSMEFFASPASEDIKGFLSRMLELFAITSPGAIPWHYVYSPQPRIVCVLRDAGGQPVAYALCKLFQARASQGLPPTSSSSQKRRKLPPLPPSHADAGLPRLSKREQDVKRDGSAHGFVECSRDVPGSGGCRRGTRLRRVS